MPNPIDLYYTWIAVADVRRMLFPRQPNNFRYMRAYTRVYSKFVCQIDLADLIRGGG